jgi:dienelactone hydrolase
MKRIVWFASSAALLTQLVYCSSSGSSGSATPDPASGVDAGTTPPKGDASTATGDASNSDGSVVNPSGNDPAKDGPYAITEIDATTKAPLTNDSVSLHVAYPTAGPAAGPYPVVILAHGYTLKPTQYYGYIKRLATFGYVAMTADYTESLRSNIKDADDLRGALDWALAATELAGKVDAAKVGVMGHSRGGKAAVLAASRDARFKAVLGLDPVDSASPLGCDPVTECPDASSAMASLSIPSAFLGETTDQTGVFQPCAPAADNYTTFYGSAPSKSLEVTLLGANHMSFLDDPKTCGTTCSFCNAETGTHADLISLARAMTVSFFERNLRGDAAQDAYLTGAQAQSRYVTPGLATIRSK